AGKRLVVIETLAAGNDGSVLVLNLLSMRKTQNPAVQIHSIAGGDNSLIVEGSAVPILHDAVISIGDLVAELVEGHGGFQHPLDAPAKFEDPLAMADGVGIADICAVGASHEGYRWDGPARHIVRKGPAIFGLRRQPQEASLHGLVIAPRV